MRLQRSFLHSNYRLRILLPTFPNMDFHNFPPTTQLSKTLASLQLRIAELILDYWSLWLLLYPLIWDQVQIFTLSLRIYYFPWSVRSYDEKNLNPSCFCCTFQLQNHSVIDIPLHDFGHSFLLSLLASVSLSASIILNPRICIVYWHPSKNYSTYICLLLKLHSHTIYIYPNTLMQNCFFLGYVLQPLHRTSLNR